MIDLTDNKELDFKCKPSTSRGCSLEKTFIEFVEYITTPTFISHKEFTVSKECKKIVEIAERMYATERGMLWLWKAYKDATSSNPPTLTNLNLSDMLSAVTDMWNMHSADAEKARRLLANAILESPRIFPIITEDEMLNKIKDCHAFTGAKAKK